MILCGILIFIQHHRACGSGSRWRLIAGGSGDPSTQSQWMQVQIAPSCCFLSWSWRRRGSSVQLPPPTPTPVQPPPAPVQLVVVSKLVQLVLTSAQNSAFWNLVPYVTNHGVLVPSLRINFIALSLPSSSLALKRLFGIFYFFPPCCCLPLSTSLHHG